MLAHRLRRWPNIETALGECPVFAVTAVQSQKVVSAHSTSKQKLPFAFQE